MHPKEWINVRPEGLYCIPGKFYIDPTHAVESAVITHAHGDHARSGHKKILATADTIDIMKVRYGNQCADHIQSILYHESVRENQVNISLVPAGHILGSSQIILEYKNSRLIISGDYKRCFDPTCTSYEVNTCDVFITEATFGLPVFIHPAITDELDKLLNSLKTYPERPHLVGAYALGKCQRLIKTLREMGYGDVIYLHGAQIKLCELYGQKGIDLGKIENASSLDKNTVKGKIIICPPSALNDRWSRRFENSVIAYASGWMRIRARAKQKGVELPLIISDHADWHELTQTIHEVNANEIWVTHGREEALVYYAIQNGYKSLALNLLRDEDEE